MLIVLKNMKKIIMEHYSIKNSSNNYIASKLLFHVIVDINSYCITIVLIGRKCISVLIFIFYRSENGKTCIEKIYNISAGFHLYVEMIPNMGEYYPQNAYYCMHRSSFSIRTTSARYFYYAIANCLLPTECSTKYCQV